MNTAFGDALNSLNSSIDLLLSREGRGGALLAHYLYYKLALLLHAYLDGLAVTEDLRTTLREYAISSIGSGEIAIATEEPPPRELYTFPWDLYLDSYQTTEPNSSMVSDSWRVNSRHNYFLFDRYHYVLGPRLEWRQTIDPISVLGSLVEPISVGDRISHLTLAREFGLNVTLAGQIAFSAGAGNVAPRALFVTTFSDYFLPRDWTANQLMTVIRRVLPNTRATSVIAVATNAIAVDGPLSEMLA